MFGTLLIIFFMQPSSIGFTASATQAAIRPAIHTAIRPAI